MPASALIALVSACLLWGTTGVVASFMSDSVSPLAVGAFTMGIGGAALLAFTWSSVRSFVATRKSLQWIVFGGIGVFVYPLAFYTGMELVGVAVGNSIALGSGPLFAGFIEWLVTKRRPETRWFIALGIALAGLVLVAIDDQGLSDASLVGVIVGLVAGFAYALYSVAGSRLISAGATFRGAMGAVFGAGAVPLLVVLAFTGWPILADAGNLARASYLAFGPLVVAYLLFGYALTRVSAPSATLVTLLEPVFSVVLAVIVIGEILSFENWAGIALLVSAVAISSLGASSRKSPTSGTSASNLGP